MRLYLLRHAEAVSHGTPGYARDAQRPLTEEGLLQARDAAAALKRLEISVERILTSPYVRAVQTATQVAEVLGMADAVTMLDQLRSEARPSETSLALKPYASAASLLAVGHEPHLSAWLAQLCVGVDGMRCIMKKAGMACVELERLPPRQGSGILRWLLTPKQLRLIGMAP